MRVLICGGRFFNDKKAVWDWFEQNLGSNDTVIHGDCHKGADKLAGEACTFFRIPVETFPADWSRDGYSAGPIRNQRMLDSGRPSLIVAFWDGTSPGTRDMLRRGMRAGLPYTIVVQAGCEQDVSNALVVLQSQTRLF